MSIAEIGALTLGTVLGFLTHYLVRRDQQPGVGDLAAIIAAVLGARIFNVITGSDQTSWYLIGLGVGFFLYWLALLLGREQVKQAQLQNKRLPVFPFLEK